MTHHICLAIVVNEVEIIWRGPGDWGVPSLKILLFQLPGFQSLIIKTLILTIETQDSCELSKHCTLAIYNIFFTVKYLAGKFHDNIFENMQRIHITHIICDALK